MEGIPPDVRAKAQEAFKVLAPGFDPFNVALIEDVIAEAIMSERRDFVKTAETWPDAYCKAFCRYSERVRA